MKRALLTLGALAIATLLSTAAFAENRSGALVVSPVIGGYHFDSKHNIDPNVLYGLKVGYNFTDRLGLEAMLHYVHSLSWKNGPTSERAVDILNARLEALYHFFPKNDFVPFLAAGYGAMTSVYDTGVFSYGIGAKYALKEDVDLRADLRHLIIDSGESLDNYEATIGLAFQFGGVKKPVKAVEAPKAAAVVPAPAPAAVVKPVPPPPPVPVAAPAPTASLAVTPQSILPGGSATLAWTSMHSTSCSIQPGIGAVQFNGVMTVSPSAETSYTMTCTGEGGSASSSTILAVSKPAPAPLPKPAIKPVPVVIDSDNDGVPDAFDTCANTPTSVKVDKNGCPIIDCESMRLSITFETNKYDIVPAHHDELNIVGEKMKKFPKAKSLMEGHTDSVGTDASNMKLSQRRADSVRKYLISQQGISAGRISAKGFGESKPIGTNDTEEGRKNNRRVEAIFTCP